MLGRWTRAGLTLLALWALPAGAQNAEDDSSETPSIDYRRPAFYVGIGGQRAITNFQNVDPRLQNPNIQTATRFSDGYGYRGWLGYRIRPDVAIETELVKFEGDAFNPKGIFIDQLVWTLNGRYSLPIPGPLEPYGSIGLGITSVNTSVVEDQPIDSVAGALRLGGGFDIFINENWALRVDASWHRPFGTDQLQGMNIISVGGGLSYFFHFEPYDE